MIASFMMAGFEAWDVNMQDLMNGIISLAEFRGVVFVGGFSYADVAGASKGKNDNVTGVYHTHSFKMSVEGYNFTLLNVYLIFKNKFGLKWDLTRDLRVDYCALPI